MRKQTNKPVSIRTRANIATAIVAVALLSVVAVGTMAHAKSDVAWQTQAETHTQNTQCGRYTSLNGVKTGQCVVIESSVATHHVEVWYKTCEKNCGTRSATWKKRSHSVAKKLIDAGAYKAEQASKDNEHAACVKCGDQGKKKIIVYIG